jgi:uncharacterized membrane protein YgaE (UPF0421/DUF939 family)
MSTPTTSTRAALSRAASRLVPRLRADRTRLRRSLWPITQTAVAAGLAFYIAHSLVGHVQPFFAPIAAAVSMSSSNDRRGQRALQLILGVTLGIGIGLGVQALLGTGPAALGVAVFLALCVALVVGHGFIAQGLIFFNQTAVAAILVIALHNSAAGWGRLVDALIGGGLALVFSMLLFPPDPQPMLRRAVQSVFTVGSEELRELGELMTRREPIDPGWLLSASERIGQALAGLAQARATAREIVRVAPRRRSQQAVVARADQLAAHVASMASAVLALGSLAAAADAGEPLPADLTDSIRRLAAALAAAAEQGGASAAEAAAQAAQAVRSAERLLPASVTQEAVIASMAAFCGRLVLQTEQARPE